MSPPTIITATTTPFASDGSVDLGAYRALLVHVALHVDAVMTPGTTGEFPALSTAERASLVSCAVDLLRPERVIAHVGAPSTRQALVELRAARDAGACRFAALTPHVLPASATAVQAHYAALREACDGELLAYIYPEITGTPVSPKELAKLAELGLDGAKLSGSAADQIEECLACAPAGWPIHSGSDGELPRVLRAGGAGVVSGVSGVMPSVWARLRDAWIARQDDAFAQTQAIAERLVATLGSSIACLKYGLDLLQLPGGATRMSIDRPTTAQRAAIEHAIAQADRQLRAALPA